MIDNAINPDTFRLQIIAAQVFKKGINDHRTQVKDQ